MVDLEGQPERRGRAHDDKSKKARTCGNHALAVVFGVRC